VESFSEPAGTRSQGNFALHLA